MGRPGFEPGTNRLKAEYSTVELATPVIYHFRNVYHDSTVFLEKARVKGKNFYLMCSP